jgi:hypothetical protein
MPALPKPNALTRLLRPLAVAAVLITLSGCSIAQNFMPKSSENVDYVREELELDTLGEIQMELEIGAAPFSDEKPTYIAIISGDDVAATLETRLADGDYRAAGEAKWQRTLGGKVVTIQAYPVEPGDKVDIGGHKSVEAEATGVTVFIQD